MTKEQLLEWHVRRTEGKWITLGSAMGAVLKSGSQMNTTNFKNYWDKCFKIIKPVLQRILFRECSLLHSLP